MLSIIIVLKLKIAEDDQIASMYSHRIKLFYL